MVTTIVSNFFFLIVGLCIGLAIDTSKWGEPAIKADKPKKKRR